MQVTVTTIMSIVSLLVAALVFGVAVVALKTPVDDIGMVSTTAMFLLFGVFGLLLDRAQQREAAA